MYSIYLLFLTIYIDYIYIDKHIFIDFTEVSHTFHDVILNHRLHGKGGNVNLCGIMKNDYNIL